MTEQPGRGGLAPAHSSETVGDRGTAGVGGTLGDRGEDERTQLRAVMRDFGPAWEIERVPPGAAWVAVTRRGSWVHVIAAHDLDTLRTKIETAELEETGRASAPSPTSPPRQVS